MDPSLREHDVKHDFQWDAYTASSFLFVREFQFDLLHFAEGELCCALIF